MFRVPENNRITGHYLLGSDSSFGNNGAFMINVSKRTKLFCIASDGMGWEHVSVHAVSDGKDRIPTWSEMCKVKDMFWGEEDCVIQYHPQKSEYVNNHQSTLHLWRPVNSVLPMPDSILVGVKEG